MNTTDSQTITTPFFSRSYDNIEMDTDTIVRLTNYRAALDSHMKSLAPKWQEKRQLLHEESKRVTIFLSKI